jgi:hypothetical protein
MRIPGLLLALSSASPVPGLAHPAERAISPVLPRIALEPLPQDTVRYTVVISGHRKGEWRVWQDGARTWRYEYEGNADDSYRFPRSERLVLDAGGLPLSIEIEGQRSIWDRWIERYERTDVRARWTARAQSGLGPNWSRTLDEGEADVSGPAYYAAVHPVHNPGVLARALLRRSDPTLPLLPGGMARLEPLSERTVETNGRSRRVRLYAIHGLDLRPTYVWLDEDRATFADEWSVLSGWEAVFPALRTAIEEALAEHHRRLAMDLAPPVRARPLVIRGARLFDPETQAVHSGTTILVEEDRISAVGPDGSVGLPADAEVIDAAGRMMLPGLWDMHTHHGISENYLELMAPLYLAAGITTARDLGSPTEPMLSLRRRVEAGEAVGPRLLLAGWIEGAGGRPTGPLVQDAAEARAVVDGFAELGYVQIKIYHNLATELVPVVIERAKQHGMRISGHIPLGMTARDAIDLGYDEIQHLDGLLTPLASGALPALASGPTPERLDAFYNAMAGLEVDSDPVQELIQLLASHGVAVDPTLAVMDAWDLVPRPWVERVADRFPSQARRRILDLYLFNLWPVHSLWDEIFGNMVEIVVAMHDAGVPILPGSDMEIAGFSLHRELELYVEAGIPAPEVLRRATIGAARVMGMDDELGSISPGKFADLILVDGDPTTNISDIRRVVTVVKGGQVYDPAAIYRVLDIHPCCPDQTHQQSGGASP